MCHRECNFGAASWALGIKTLPLPQDTLLYFKHFGVQFLSGKIFQEIQRYTKSLLIRPETLLKSWAQILQKERVEPILNQLVQHDITSKAKLRLKFGEDAKFLLDEYCNWLPESRHQEVQLIWPPDDWLRFYCCCGKVYVQVKILITFQFPIHHKNRVSSMVMLLWNIALTGFIRWNTCG